MGPTRESDRKEPTRRREKIVQWCTTVTVPKLPVRLSLLVFAFREIGTEKETSGRHTYVDGRVVLGTYRVSVTVEVYRSCLNDREEVGRGTKM